jgi:hypothetical protein
MDFFIHQYFFQYTGIIIGKMRKNYYKIIVNFIINLYLKNYIIYLNAK